MQENSQVTLYVDGKKITAPKGNYLLDILHGHGFKVPSLCHHPGLPPYGACRLCLVQLRVNKKESLVASCTYPVREEGIEVFTDTGEVIELRKMILKLLLARAPLAEPVQELAREYRLDFEDSFEKAGSKGKPECVEGVEFKENNYPAAPDSDKESYEANSVESRDEFTERCILCGLCVRACNEVLQKNAISFVHRGVNREVAPPLHRAPENCKGCTACSHVCPTGAIYTRVKAGYIQVSPWGSEREMAVCLECGREYFPSAEVTLEVSSFYRSTYNGMENMQFISLCPECRRKAVIGKITAYEK